MWSSIGFSSEHFPVRRSVAPHFCPLTICQVMWCTTLLDEEGIYNPAAFNDRLLLGLKGTMSEAELHLLRSRLRGGILNKAQRGELMLRLPVGLVHLADGRCVRDPDAGIQASMPRCSKPSPRPAASPEHYG